MTIKEQTKLLNNCIAILKNLNGDVLDKEQWYFKFKIKGDINENTVTLPNPEKSALKGFIHVYSRFDKMNSLSGYFNHKHNVFISDFNDFQNFIDNIINKCYSQEDMKKQKVFDTIGERDLVKYNSLYK